jgi:hypothetical protein
MQLECQAPEVCVHKPPRGRSAAAHRSGYWACPGHSDDGLPTEPYVRALGRRLEFRWPGLAAPRPVVLSGRSLPVAQFCMHSLDSPDRYVLGTLDLAVFGAIEMVRTWEWLILPGARVRSHAVSSFRMERRSRSAGTVTGEVTCWWLRRLRGGEP